MTEAFPERWLLIQKFGLIGDTVFHLQAIHAIAAIAPRKCLTLGMPHPLPSADLFVDDPAVEGILKMGHGLIGRLHNISLLRKERFARAWLLGRSTAHALTFLCAGIQERLAYGYDWVQRLTLTRSLYRPLPQPIPEIALRSYDFLKAQGVPFLPEGRKPVLSTARIESAAQQYAEFPRPWIAFGIGASEAKRLWPVPHWIFLAKALYAHYGTGTVFLCGGRQDLEHAREIASPLSPSLSVAFVIGEHLATVGSLFHHVDLFVGNDSGLFNLAGVIEACPVFGLFGVSPALTYLPHIIPIVPNPGSNVVSMEVLAPDSARDTILQRVPTLPAVVR
ncbi:MAG: hypothetical protein LBF76_03280 [Holosporales bacterium]|jgi:heptosyltransferase-2|nr:hypothetical protein [Holosporales bacterium]